MLFNHICSAQILSILKQSPANFFQVTTVCRYRCKTGLFLITMQIVNIVINFTQSMASFRRLKLVLKSPSLSYAYV